MDELSVIDIVCIGTLIGAVLLALWILTAGLRRNISSIRATLNQDLGLVEEDSSSLDSEGLDKQVIEALPVFDCKSHEGYQCAVCLSEFGDTERAKLLPNCNHYFHKECIDIWFRLHTSCPVCRTRVQPNSFSSVFDLEKDNGREVSLTERPISLGTCSDAAEDQNAASNMDQGTSGAMPLPHLAIHVPKGSS